MKLLLLLNKTPFFLAVENENIDIIKILLSNNAIDVNSNSILKLSI